MMQDEILRIRGKNYRKMTRRLLEEAGLDMLIRKKAEILGLSAPEQIRIGIKPNLASPTPAEFGATTHIEIVEALLQYLQESGYCSLTIMEGSWVGDDTEEAFEVLGFRELAQTYAAALIDTKKDGFTEKKVEEYTLAVCNCAADTQFLINLPVLKGHCQTKMTCALKNMKGLIPDQEKRRFHRLGLHRPIACLNLAIRQDFILVDDICGDPDFEDGGNPWVRDTILAGTDPVLIDTYAAMELGYSVPDIDYLRYAAQLGIGSAEPGSIRLKDVFLPEDAKEKSREIPPRSLDRSYLDVSYDVNEADTCSACYANLTEALLRLRLEGISPELPEKISIGQGMRGKTGKYGIGQCCSGFDYAVPGCPPDPEAIYDSIKAWSSGTERL